MGFSFKSIEHKLASVGADIVKGAKAVDQFLASAAAKAKTYENTVETLSAFVDPAAVPVERAAFAALGLIAKAANDADQAAAAKGVSVVLDAETWADFQAVYKVLASRAGFLAIDPQAPAPVPATAPVVPAFVS